MVLKLNKKNINIIVKENKWKGNGTKETPFIISNKKLIFSTIRLNNLDYFLELKNCSFKKISLIKCQNIVINNCNFKSIGLYECRNIFIENNKFERFNALFLCSQIIIQGNTFKKIVPHYCRAINIVNNEISKKNLKRIQNNKIFYFYPFLPIISIILILIISFFLYYLILCLIGISIMYVLILICYYTRTKKIYSRLKNLPPNEIKNNKSKG